MNIVIIGLSITSSWGNGHATTYRSLVRGLAERGHKVLFLEEHVPWYAENRDLPRPPYCATELYEDLPDLKERFARQIRKADLVVVGSYVRNGIQVGAWVCRQAEGIRAFYDIDTPVTLARLAKNSCEYLSQELMTTYDLYLSFTGGPLLRLLEDAYAVRRARVLYCSVDPDLYRPEKAELRWDLGYLGTYSPDRQRALSRLMHAPARRQPEARFVVAGPMYPARIRWPKNLERIEHVAPGAHVCFYRSLRFTLNLTRRDMRDAGYSPSVRLFEAAACGVAVISDPWQGLSDLFEPGKEILIAKDGRDVSGFLCDLPERRREEIGTRFRERVLREHTGAVRARELEQYVMNVASEQLVRPLPVEQRATIKSDRQS